MFDPELPPTAGLPLVLGDLLPGRERDLALDLERDLGLPPVGIESSGTAALIVILKTLYRRYPARRRVIVPAYTCPLVVLAVAYCGLEVVLCDVAYGRFELDLQQLAALCQADTLAVIPTHLGGRVADVASVVAVARPQGVAVIEDGAQALGARRAGQSIGWTGDACFFSFAVGKGLTLFEGGAWVTPDPLLRAELAESHRCEVPSRPILECWRCVQLLAYAVLYRPLALPWVYGLPLRRALRRRQWIEAVGDEFDAAIPLHRVSSWRRSVGSRALTRLGAFQRRLREQAAQRVPALSALPGLTVLADHPGDEGSWPFFLLLAECEEQRDRILQALWTSGLGVSRLFIAALPDYPYLRPYLSDAAVPNARDFAARSFTITNSHWLDDACFAQILAVLRRVLT